MQRIFTDIKNDLIEIYLLLEKHPEQCLLPQKALNAVRQHLRDTLAALRHRIDEAEERRLQAHIFGKEPWRDQW